MRHSRPVLIALVALVLLVMAGVLMGCGRRSNYAASPESVTVDGRTATVSVGSETDLIVVLDGQTYTYRRTLTGAVSGAGLSGPVDAPASDYMLVDQVVDQWLRGHPQWEHPRRTNPGTVLAGLLIVGLGVLSIAKPDTVWYISDGWKFRNAEPSDLALTLTRAGGLIMVIVGLVVTLNS